MIKGLWNYAVKVRDLDGAAAFYQSAMGAKLRISDTVLGCDYRLLRLGGTRIILFERAPYEHLLDEALPLGFLHAVYEVDDFDAQVAALRQAGVTFLLGPEEIEAAFGRRKIVFFEAPDGLRTEVMQILHDTGKA